MSALTPEEFNRFIDPASVAVIGASSKTGPGHYNLFENLLREGCRAQLYPVNTRATDILGIPAYPSVKDIPESVDLAIIVVPRQFVVEAVRECTEIGVPAAVVITQGFADADKQGQAWQQEMQEIIAGTDTRLIGPNTIGLANAFNEFHTSFQKFDLYPKANALICQSGMFILASADFISGLGLGVDIGNAADVGFTELLPCMAADDRVRVINLHMESLANAEQFVHNAANITPDKPVLVYKVGRSAKAAEAAASHSGALAGEDHVFDAAFNKAGIIRVDDLDEMLDLNKALLTYPAMRGRRIAVVSLSGGGGIAVLDALGQCGLDVAQPSQAVMDAIQAMNPPWLEAGNPVDTWLAALSNGLAEATQEILGLLLSDDQVDGAIVLLNAYRTTGFEVMDPMLAGIVAEAGKRRDKPVALWAFGLNQDAVIARAEESEVVAGFTSPERTARALAGLYHYHHDIKGHQREPSANFDDVDPDRVAALLSEAEGTPVLGSATLDILEAYGIRVARARLASEQTAALEMADKIGYPLAIKVASDDVVHKSDVGGVRLDIRNADELLAAWDDVLAGVRAHVPGAAIDGMYLQPYHQGGVELIVGARCSDFGPLIVFGLGGIYTEILKDVVFNLAPLGLGEAQEMIHRLKSYSVLAGARGGDKIDETLLAESLCRVAQLVSDFPQIQELDINPLAATSGGVLALDARAVLAVRKD
jgi:acyl-CoA synthetase (NDP forming)